MASRRGCRHYAATYLHGGIDPNETLIIDPKDGDIDVCVSIQILRGGAKGRVPERRDTKTRVGLARESIVHVRYLPNLGSGAVKLLSDIRDHARMVTRGKGQSARAGCGDRGSMHPVGMRVMKDKKTRLRYKTSGNARELEPLRRAVVASARLAAVTIPGVLRIIQDTEADGDVGPDPGMDGGGEFLRVSYSMDISVDLENASHYDVNDASPGYSIWTEDEPGSTRNWFFVLPNVYGKWPPGSSPKNGPVFHGLAIKLTHGTLVSWDGRVIRHCTSMMQRTKHVYGSFFAAKSSVVAYGARMAFMRDSIRRRQARRRRGRTGTGGDDGAGCKEAQKGGASSVCDATNIMLASSSATTQPAGVGAAAGFVAEGEVWVDLLSAPIARRKKAVREGDPLYVPIGMAGVDLRVADAVFGDSDSIVNRVDEIACDDESWTGHSYASDGGDSGSVDSGMVVNFTDNHGKGFMEEVMIDDDNTSSMGV